MSDTSRRNFLALTGAGAAALGTAAAVPGAFGANRLDTVPADGPPRSDDDVVDGPLVAYVSDVTSGEILVMVGDHEVSIVDRELASRISRLAHVGR